MTASSHETTAQLQCIQKGGPFEVVHVPKLVPGPEEVLIRQRVVALNPIDVKRREHGIEVPHWPFVLGIEGAGTIVTVGSGVHHLSPDDEVMAWEAGDRLGVSLGGAFQEHVLMPASFVAKKPKNISLEEAASLPICFATAACAIVNSLKIPLPFLPSTPTDGAVPTSVLVLGGSSATGAAAIQLLRIAYPSLSILATSSVTHHTRLIDLGATHVVDYKSPTVVSDLRVASPGGTGVDMIIDCVSAGASQTDICNTFDPAGSKKYAAVITGVTVSVTEGVQMILASAWTILDMPGGKQIIPSLTKLVEQGTYKVSLPVRVLGHGLAEIPNVMDEVMRVSGEKVVVTI